MSIAIPRTGLFILALVACGKTTVVETRPPIEPGFKSQFFPFDQPRTDEILGMGFDPAGTSLNSTCYQYSKSDTSRAIDRELITWDQQTGDTAGISVLHALGLSISDLHATRGLVRLDSTVTMEAVNLRPAANCTDKVGLYPRLPAVARVYGTRGFVMTVWDSSNKQLGLDSLKIIPGVQAVANRVSARGDSVAITFNGLRWIGYQLIGFQRAVDSVEVWHEDARALPVSGDEVDFIDGQYRLAIVRIDRGESLPRYRVDIRPAAPPGAASRIVTVNAFQAFVVSSIEPSKLEGMYYEARLVPIPDSSPEQVHMRYRPFGAEECAFRHGAADFSAAIAFGKRDFKSLVACPTN